MAYDAYGRVRGAAEPDYFPSTDSSLSSSQFPAEARDVSSSDYRIPSIPRQANMSAPERAGSMGPSEVSPELLAAITERVKKEIVEHLKQTGSLDDQAPPLQRDSSNASNSTSSPPSEASKRAYTPPSPTHAPKHASYPQPTNEPMRSPPASPLEKPSNNVRFSDRRPPAASRTYSSVELSAVDQKWGRLIDSDGNPTQRLGQFLRGLANHIIEEFVPKKSIVVTPAKMATYYVSYALDNEIHPLSSIFKAQSNEQISRLYQDLGCQHHLVQDQSSNAPTIPALTPVGFAHWMTIFLLAYPDAEAKRLEKVVLALPIDADGQIVDGKPERLPKQISRHLLPEKEDRKSIKLVEDAIANFYDDLGSTSRRKPTIASPPLTRTSSVSQSRPRPVEIHQASNTSPTISSAPPLERERKPYAGAPSTASEASSNDDPVKIERDRQPYTAQPGGGKVYTDSSNIKTGTRPNRANSTSRTTRTRSPSESESRHHRTSSTTSYVPPPRAGSRRTSSPPLKKYSESVPGDIGGYKSGPPLSTSSSTYSQSSQHFTPSSYGPSSTIPPPPPPMDGRDPRDKRVRDERPYRRGTEDGIIGAEFNSPRDAERWDRFQESRSAEADRPDRMYDKRSTISIDPRELRGATYEDWYREPSSARSTYDSDRRY